MDKNMLMARVAAILTTLDEVGGTPESNLYLLCDTNMDDYQVLRRILIDAKWVKISSNYVTLTEAGKTTAQRINKAIGC